MASALVPGRMVQILPDAATPFLSGLYGEVLAEYGSARGNSCRIQILLLGKDDPVVFVSNTQLTPLLPDDAARLRFALNQPQAMEPAYESLLIWANGLVAKMKDTLGDLGVDIKRHMSSLWGSTDAEKWLDGFSDDVLDSHIPRLTQLAENYRDLLNVVRTLVTLQTGIVA